MKNIMITLVISIVLVSIIYAQNKVPNAQVDHRVIEDMSGKPTPEMRERHNKENKMLDKVLRDAKKSPSKGVLEIEKMRKAGKNDPLLLIALAISYDALGNMPSAYKTWRESLIMNLPSDSGDAFLWAKFAIAAAEVRQFQDADFAYKKAVYWLKINSVNAFNPKEIEDIRTDNVRIDKDNIEAVSYLVLGICEHSYTRLGRTNQYTGSTQADKKAAQYFTKAIALGRGKVKEVAKRQAAKPEDYLEPTNR